MASKVKEKPQQLLQKYELKCRELIGNFKKSIAVWILYRAYDETTFQEIQNSCVEIVLDGLKYEKLQTNTNIAAINDSLPSTSSSSFTHTTNSDPEYNALHKIIDDFEWVRNAVNIRHHKSHTKTDIPLSYKTGTDLLVTATTSPRDSRLYVPERPKANSTPAKDCHLSRQLFYAETSQLPQSSAIPTNVTHLKLWLMKNLNEHNLCGFLQYLASDKELLEEHYGEEALLRQELYVTTLHIGLTAFETKQFDLLIQIDAVLKGGIKNMQHKRSNSQPNIIVLPAKTTIENDAIKTKSILNKFPKSLTPQRSTVLLTIRKTKSLPEIMTNEKTKEIKDVTDSNLRPRCKTLGVIKRKRTKPQNIIQSRSDVENAINLVTATSSGSSSYEDSQPSTSQANTNRSKSPLSNYTLNSSTSNSTNSMCTSISSTNSNTTARRIQLINTDDIKIWTDHSWELKHKSQQQQQQQPTPNFAIPTATTTGAPITKPTKSLSPLNSFLSSLFSTPPSYTSWFTNSALQEEYPTTETAIDYIVPDHHPNQQQQNHHSVMSSTQSSTSLSSTMFDKFLPIDGQKLRSRKSQNLFEDLTTLDYTTPSPLLTPSTTEEGGSLGASPCSTTPKNCQSLTRFLQMSHLSRNNTELEKENAHFRISEAIISAIEHIKWNKLERQKENQNKEATPLATDCLASSGTSQTANISLSSNDIIECEHIPYAELEEVSYDLLSAEVVGLSLISKFDEKHLPKVSELKWLVSDDDTPQKLLPMPDLTSSSNPDENVIHSVTRGTRYWAPPRQQIIFTDHPPPNRKDVLKKQNYRCAGCGMRVSPQYMQSFRYCTYLGKYNCTGCHRNQISCTPAKILQAWDFKCYPVSVFAYRLLEQMYAYPLFYVPDLNPALYVRSKSLLNARNKRLQLKYVKDFIRMCRFALREQTYFESIPDYITSDIDNWSMSDFIDARSKCLQRSIDELINKCENHIFNCVLCTARGFLCEYCHADVVIYPWDSRVERCVRCGSCFHRSCWKSMSELCCRCQRIDKRHDEINDVI